MLGSFQAFMPKKERGLVLRAHRGGDRMQKMLIDMSATPRRQTKGVGGRRVAARAIAALSFALTRRFA
jgi:hypothetical protein